MHDTTTFENSILEITTSAEIRARLFRKDLYMRSDRDLRVFRFGAARPIIKRRPRLLCDLQRSFSFSFKSFNCGLLSCSCCVREKKSRKAASEKNDEIGGAHAVVVVVVDGCTRARK